MNETTGKPHLIDYKEYMKSKLKNDPELHHEYLVACLEHANDPESTDEEVAAVLRFAVRAIVEKHGGVDDFVAQSKVRLSEDVLQGILDGKWNPEDLSAASLIRVFNADGLTVTVSKAS